MGHPQSSHMGHLQLARGTLAAWLLLLCSCIISTPATARPVQHLHETTVSSRRLAQANSTDVGDDFSAARACPLLPSAANSTRDDSARLWGWDVEANSSCAYKTAAGHVLWYPDYIPGSWLHTPPCSMPPFPDSSVVDSSLKVWGWEVDGTLCAFKDDQQQPYPMNTAFRTSQLSWPDAPTCTEEPTPTVNNSMPDKLGCLWGWQVSRNCAFKSQPGGQPIYYAGYKACCNTTASVVRAAEFNADDGLIVAAEFSYDGNDRPLQTPGVVVQMAEVGQMHHAELLGNSSQGDFSNAPFDVPASALENSTSAFPALPQNTISAANATNTANTTEATLTQPDNTTTTTNTTEATIMQPDNTTSALPNATDDEPKVTPLAQTAQMEHTEVNTAGSPAADFSKAPFAVPEPQTIHGPSSWSTSGVRRRRLVDDSQVYDPQFPKGKPQPDSGSGPAEASTSLSPRDCSRTFEPYHGSSATTGVPGCMPEKVEQPTVISASDNEQQTVTHEAANVPAEQAPGPLPTHVLRSLEDTGVAVVTTPNQDQITVSESESPDGATGGSNILSVGHTSKSNVPGLTARRLTATAVSIASATSDGSGNAIATGVSSGDSQATAVSHAGGNSSTNATAVATDGHVAVAIVNATKGGGCILSLRVINKHVEWHCGVVAMTAGQNASDNAPPPPAGTEPTTTDTDMWAAADTCTLQADKTNSVQDALGRLWGFNADQQRPCAFKSSDGAPIWYPGYQQIKFETAPACNGPPTTTNSMSDAQGRLWGWDQAQQTNCAFKDASTGEAVYIQSSDVPPMPSAAGPSNAISNTTSNATTTANTTELAAGPQYANATPPAVAAVKPTVADDNTTATIALAADAQAQAITGSLSANATREEIALASAKTAIVYH